MADKFQLKAILSAVDKLSPTLKGIRLNAKITRKAIKDIGSAGGQLMNKVGIPSAIAFGAVVFGAERATRAAIEYASGIQDAADRTGQSVEDYQALTNMLGQVGGGAEDAEMAVTKFNKGIAEASAGGNKAFVGLFKKLKIPIKDSKGQIQSLAAVLPQLAKGFAANTNAAVRTRMATTLFSKGGTKMIPVLTGIADGTLSLVEAQKLMGSILSKESVGALDDLGDSLDATSVQIKSTFASAIAQLAPVLQPLIKSLSVWIGKNQDLIKTKIVTFLSAIATNLAKVDWLAFIQGIQDTLSAIGNFVDKIGGVKTLMIGLGIAWIAGPVSALITIAASMFSLIGVIGSLVGALMGLEIAGGVALAFGGAIILAVGLVAAGAYMIYKNWGPIKAWFISLWEGIKSAFSVGWDFLKTVFAWSPLGLILQSWGPVVKFFTGLWDTVKNIVGASPQTGQNNTPPGGRFGNSGGGPTARGAGSSTNILAAAGNTKLNGQLNVNFTNAPAGMRVDSVKTNQPGVNMNADVGYRSLGMAY